MSKYIQCPCFSKALYHKCCQPYHEGAPVPDALILMRSRFSAYALDLPDYIIKTTAPENANYQSNCDQWRSELHQFSSVTRFAGLQILQFVGADKDASVTFCASLFQGDKNISFTEKSTFSKASGSWLYKAGEIE